MNQNGRLRSWGDADFARKLNEFAEIEVTPNPGGLAGIFDKLEEVFGPGPYTYWGEQDPKDYSPDVTGRITNRLVRAERKSRKPFFIWWSVAAPHREDVAVTLMGRPGADPRPPARYADEVKRLKLPRPPSFNEADFADKPSNMRNSAPLMTDEQIAQLELDYQGRIGSLWAVDDGVARLVRTLRRTGQLENTLIVFLSDNGWMQGEHRVTGDKFLPYEESLRIPLIVRGPGVPAGRTVRGQVANIDLAPTLVDVANARAGRKMDGISLLPAIRNPRKHPQRAIQIEALDPLFRDPVPVNQWDRPYSGVRTDRYTYVVWTETGEKELYDRRKDPHQLTNVAGESAYARVEARLARKLRQLDGCKGAACNVRP
jgi:arylsulfatase A-like enzyme